MVPPWILLALLVPFGLDAAPAEGLQSVEVRLGADAATFRTHTTLATTEAAQVRLHIDTQFGDADGAVEAAEIDAYQAAQEVRQGADRPECFETFRLVRLADKAPVALREQTLRLEGALGPVASQAPLHERRFQRYGFDVRSSDPVATLDLRGLGDVGVRHPCAVGGRSDLAAGNRDPPPPAATILIAALPAQRLQLEQAEPAVIRAHWRDDALRPRTPDEQRPYWNGPIQIPVESGQDTASFATRTTSPTPRSSLLPWGLGLAALLLVRPAWRWLTFFAFSRMGREKVFDHAGRATLYRLVTESPGPSVSSLARAAGMTRVTVRWHLRVLEAQRHVRLVRRGRAVRVFPTNVAVPPEPTPAAQLDLAAYLRAHPGQSQRQIANALGLPRTTVAYRLKALEKAHRRPDAVDG